MKKETRFPFPGHGVHQICLLRKRPARSGIFFDSDLQKDGQTEMASPCQGTYELYQKNKRIQQIQTLKSAKFEQCRKSPRRESVYDILHTKWQLENGSTIDNRRL